MAEEAQSFGIQNKYRKVADRPNTGLFSTLNAIWKKGMVYVHLGSGFGLIKANGYVDKKNVFEKFERPPYPIIMSDPSIGDIVRNFNSSDIFAIFVLYSAGKHSANIKRIGIVGGFLVARNMPSLSHKYGHFSKPSPHILTIKMCLCLNPTKIQISFKASV